MVLCGIFKYFSMCVYVVFSWCKMVIFGVGEIETKKGWLPPSWWIQREVQEIITRTEATIEDFIFISIGSFMCILLFFCFGENTTRDQKVILLQERIITSCGL